MFCNKSIFLSLIYTHNLPHYSFLGMRFGLVGMWVGFALDENIRGVILVRRWRSGKWRTKGFVK